MDDKYQNLRILHTFRTKNYAESVEFVSFEEKYRDQHFKIGTILVDSVRAISIKMCFRCVQTGCIS